MTVTREAVVAFLDGLSTLELAELIAALQERLGVRLEEAAVRVVMGAAPVQVVMGAEPESTEFDVVLEDFGGDKVAVIRALRELSPIGLREAKALVESAPVKVREFLPREEAKAIAERLRAAGARVSVR